VKFLLVRHGETEWNKLGRFQGQQDIALNERGLAQARETAQALATLKPTALYSSPLHRTMQAAEEISRVVGLPVVKEEGFKELRLGDLEGVTGQEMRDRWPQVYAAWRSDPATVAMPNGESLGQLQGRQHLVDRRGRHRQKVREVSLPSAAALRDVERHRARGPAQLTDQSERFGLRKS